MKNTVAAICVVVTGMVYSRMVNYHFGNNWWPKDSTEVCADYLGLILFAIGWLAFWRAWNERK